MSKQGEVVNQIGEVEADSANDPSREAEDMEVEDYDYCEGDYDEHDGPPPGYYSDNDHQYQSDNGDTHRPSDVSDRADNCVEEDTKEIVQTCTRRAIAELNGYIPLIDVEIVARSIFATLSQRKKAVDIRAREIHGSNYWGDESDPLDSDFPSRVPILCKELWPTCYYSAKFNGMPYICYIKTNGECDMIARQYADKIDLMPAATTGSSSGIESGSDVVLVLSGELVTWMSDTAKKSKNDPKAKKNTFVVFDVLSPDVDMPIPKKLQLLRRFIWDGRCKRCGMLNTYKEYSLLRHDNKLSCLATGGQCEYGLKLHHPLFSQLVVKRSMRGRDFQLANVNNMDRNGAIFENQPNAEPLLPLFDGIIFDSYHRRVKPQVPVEQGTESQNTNEQSDIDIALIQYRKNRVRHVHENPNESDYVSDEEYVKQMKKKIFYLTPQSQYCYRYKWGSFISLDILIKKAIRNSTFNPKIKPYCTSKSKADHDYQCYLVDRDGELQEYKSGDVIIPRYFIKRDVIVECVYDYDTNSWIFQRERIDKSIPNSIEFEEQLRQYALQIPPFGIPELQDMYQQYTDTLAHKDVNDHDEVLTVSDIEDLLWNTKCSMARELIRIVTHDQSINEGLNQLSLCNGKNDNDDNTVSLPLPTFDIDRCISTCYNISHPLCRMFAYHDRIKSFLYSLFSNNIVIDIGPGKCTNRYELQHIFNNVIMIDKNICFVDNIIQDKHVDSNKLTILHGDACDPSMRHNIHEILQPIGNKAKCCFAFFSFQGLLSNATSLANFARNITSNMLDEDSYLIAIMGTAQSRDRYSPFNFTVSMKSNGSDDSSDHESTSTVVDGDTVKEIFHLRNICNCSNWVNGVSVNFYSSTYKEDQLEYFPINLDLPNHPMHQILYDYGGLQLQRIIPLDSFHHFFTSEIDSKLFDNMTEIERNISSKYTCVIWKRVNCGLSSNVQQVVPVEHPSSDDIGKKCKEGDGTTLVNTSTLLLLDVLQPTAGNNNERKYLPIDILHYIFNYMSIYTHFQLANTCKTNLQFYLKGLTTSFYSTNDIIQSYKFLYKQSLELFYIEEELLCTCKYMSTHQYNILLRLPCYNGCFLCNCMQSLLPSTRRIQNDSLYYSGEENLYHEHKCICMQCLMNIYYRTSSNNIHSEKYYFQNHRNVDVISIDTTAYNYHQIASKKEKSNDMIQTVNRLPFMKLLMLKSLFLNNSAVSNIVDIRCNVVKDNDVNCYCDGERDDEWLVRLLPELFSGEMWNSPVISSTLQSIRKELDDLVIIPMIAYGYLLPGALYEADDEETGRATAMKRLEEIIKCHVSWRERWIALRVGANNKVIHQYATDKSKYSNESPFGTEYF